MYRMPTISYCFPLLGPNPRKSKNTLVEVNESATENKNKFSYKVVENKDNKVHTSGPFN